MGLSRLALRAPELSGQHQIHQLPDGAVAAVSLGDDVGFLQHCRSGIGRRRGHAGDLHSREIVHIIAHEADVIQVKMMPLRECAQRCSLVVTAFRNVAKISSCRQTGPPGDCLPRR